MAHKRFLLFLPQYKQDNASVSMSAYDRTSPHRGLVPAPDGRNIAHGKDRSGSRFGGFSKFSQKKFPAQIFVVARQQRGVPLSDKGTRSARLGRSPESNAF